MKKILVSLILLVGLVFGGGYFLAFTQKGNDILKPFINSYLKQKVKEADIMIESFTLKPNHIKAKANINKMVDISIDGSFDIAKKSFDTIYTVKAKKIQTPEFKFDEKIYIKGKAVGNLKKALIFGVGKVANSDIEYKLDLIDEKPQNITAKIDRASLKKLLLLAGQKPYADGIVTLNANIPSLDEKNLKGSTKLTIQRGSISNKLIQKDFKVELPKNFTFSLNSDASLKGDNLLANTTLNTSLANLKLPNTTYNLKSNTLKSKYNLYVKDLSKLYSLSKMKLRGDFRANGNISLKNKLFSASLNTNSLGGNISAFLVGDKLKATIKQLSTKVLFYKLNMPNYTTAKVDGDINLRSLKALAGDFHIKANGIYPMEKQNINYNSKVDGILKNKKVLAKVFTKTNLADITLSDIVFDMKTATLNSKYVVFVDNLAKLNKLSGQKLVGNLKAVGTIKKAKDLIVDGTINKFDGVIKYKLINDKLTATVSDATLTKIQKTLSYPPMLEAKAYADFNYNLTSSKGKAVIKMKEAKMLPNQLTQIITSLGGTDLSAQHYNDTVLVANLTKNLITFDFDAKSKSVILEIKNGKIHQPSGLLDAKLNIKAGKNSLSLKISGTTTNPKIRLSGSSLENNLKQKAKERLKEKEKELKQKAKEKLENSLKEKLGIDKLDEKEAVKGLLKKLF